MKTQKLKTVVTVNVSSSGVSVDSGPTGWDAMAEREFAKRIERAMQMLPRAAKNYDSASSY